MSSYNNDDPDPGPIGGLIAILLALLVLMLV
jgi:hypothetical protein